MKTRSDRHPRIPVATTPEEFDACFASGADGETGPMGIVKDTGQWWSSPGHIDLDPTRRRWGLRHITAAPCRSGPVRNPHRSASRAARWRRPVSAAPPCFGIPCGNAFCRGRVSRLRCRGGFHDRSIGRMPSPGTDPSRKTLSAGNRPDSGRHTFETRIGARNP